MIAEVFAKHYPGHHEDGHLVYLFADFICWARDFNKRPASIIETAASYCQIDVPEGGIPSGFRLIEMWNEDHPQDESGHRKNQERVAERASCFASILDEFYEDEDTSIAATCLVKEVFEFCGDPIQVFLAMQSGDRRFNSLCGASGVIYGDEFYSREELIKAWGGDTEGTDKFLREMGFDPTEDQLIPGHAINMYIKKHSRSMEDWEEDQDDA